ncbi:MAG: hypothetical protein KJP25_09425 [Gammaproteobacteria bacterium]|nr:hypothetical protein [Gammaproteobacteria bacterium]MBT8149880.1 hypothetical protein [Gammaproteobacteria bacterium]NND38995.1 hypothetical protein [Pseudomonadales bacterium]NNL11042.1 hypothetical protein [Pseudomonadales bacterium]NNM10406.1 hypothetical protein [Pseudomonadales bacterium]
MKDTKPKAENANGAATDQAEQALLEKVTAQLDSDANTLDGATQSALNQARAAAMASASSGVANPAAGFRWQWPAAAMAAALAVVIVYPALDSPGLERSGAAVAELAAATDENGELLDDESLAMLNTLPGEGFEFYEELEFIQWLEEQQDVAASPGEQNQASSSSSISSQAHHA